MGPREDLKNTIDEIINVEHERLDQFMSELQTIQTAKEIINIKKDLTLARCRLHPQKYYITEEDLPGASFNEIKAVNTELEEGFVYGARLYNQLHKKCSDILEYADLLLDNIKVSTNTDSLSIDKIEQIFTTQKRPKDFIDKIKSLVNRQKGRRLAMIIYVLYKEGYIRFPEKAEGGLEALFKILVNSFGATGTVTGFRDSLHLTTIMQNKNPFDKKEDIASLEEIKKRLG